MESQIPGLSNLENELVQTAHATHGAVFDNAERIVSFANEAFILTNQQRGWIFMLYLSQVRANLLLMLLSTIRKHDIQMLMMARQMLEATSWACYSLSQQEFAMKISSTTSAETIVQEMKTWDKKIYKWLDSEFSKHSNNIKALKGKINEDYAHAGIYAAQNNSAVDEAGNIKMAFFDERDMEFVSQRLWFCASSALHVIGLVADVVEKYRGAVDLTADFNETYKLLSSSTDKLLSQKN